MIMTVTKKDAVNHTKMSEGERQVLITFVNCKVSNPVGLFIFIISLD